MSVAAATGAVSTHQHQQPTAEQIRLAQLIDDKKHDQPEVQDIVRKVLDVVANSTQEDALLALFDCDYDYEKAVALLIEKGHDIASEWRTATNHKLTKKQQQQKSAATKNGFGGENDENGQQRGNDGSTHRGKSRVGRSRFQHQQNGGDFQNNNNQQQQNDNYNSQQRQRGGSSYRGRNRGSYRGGSRGNDRNHQQYEQQLQDSNLDTSSPSDTTQRFTDVPYTNRRGGGGGGRQQQQQQWDVGNWNGETLIYSRSAKDDEQSSNSDNNNMSHTINGPPGETSHVNNISELNTQQKLKSEFDPIEAARQIKNVIGIGQSQQQQQQSNAPPPKPLMDIKPLMGNQQIGQQQKSNIIQSKSIGQNLSTKVTPPPPRIPHQPVIFSDRFDGGMHKIDVQFGNLGESLEDTSSQNVSIPIASTSSAFYQHSQPITSVTKQNTMLSSVQNSQRSATTTIPHHSTEQSPFVSLSAHTHSTRPSEQQQQPVMNQQRVLPPHMQQQQPQQPSMTMKNVVPPQYAVHHQQHQMNAQNLLLQSLLYHAHPQQESVQLDTSYDPAAFQLPSLDFNTPYFMAPTLNQQPQQPQTQQRYLVSQQPLPPQQQQQPQSQQQQQQQQTASNRQPSSTNVQTATTSSSVPSSSTSTTSTAPKKGPAVPPGMFLSTAPPTQPAYSNAYSTTYGVPPSVGGQQQPGATTYSTPYDPEHLFTNAFMQLANAQAQSPSGTYGSITPPVQQQNQQQQTHNNNDNKTMNYRAPFNENLVLLQQYQQYAIQQSNSQQQGQQATAHSSAPLSYFLGHPASGPSYSPGPPIMFAQPATAMTQQQQQQTVKQQGQQYNQNNPSVGIGGNDDYYGRASSSSSSNKEAQYIYTVPTQPQQVPPQSVGQHQGVNKQQRGSGNVYNNQQNQQRPFQ